MALIDQLNTITQSYWMPTLVDQIFKTRDILNVLTQKQKRVGSGSNIKIPVMYDTVPADAYSKTDTLDITPKDFIGGATFDWSYYWSGNSIFELDLMWNKGKERVVDLSKAAMENIQKSLQKKIADQLFTLQSGKHMLSLTDAINYSATSVYGGIDRSTYTWFRGNVTGSAGLVSFEMLETMMNTCYIMPKSFPDVIVTTKAIWEKIWSLQYAKVGFYDSPKGFDMQIVPFGKAKIIWDESCPSGYIYFLNTNHIWLVTHPQDSFTFTGWRDVLDATGQRRYDGRVFWTGQLISDMPAALGLLTGVTTSA